MQISSIKRVLKYILIPLAVFVFDVVLSIAVNKMIPNEPVIAMAVEDACMVAVSMFVALKLFGDLGFTRGERYRFSPMGLTVAFFAFVLGYMFSQGFSAGLRTMYPDVFVQFFDDVSEKQAPAYVLFCVTLGPVAEELLYRGLLYRGSREVVGRIPAFILSTLLFVAAHGTIIHIPVAIMTSLMCVWAYELTGSLLWSIGVHCLHNLFGVSFSVWTGVSGTVFGVMTVVVAAAFCVSLIFMNETRDFLRKGRFRSLEAWVDEQRKKPPKDA